MSKKCGAAGQATEWNKMFSASGTLSELGTH